MRRKAKLNSAMKPLKSALKKLRKNRSKSQKEYDEFTSDSTAEMDCEEDFPRDQYALAPSIQSVSR